MSATGAPSLDGFCLSHSTPLLGESFGGALQPRQVDKCAREKLDVAIREEIASMEERRLQAIAR